MFFDYTDITPAGTTGWQDVDLSAIVPSDTTGVSIVVVVNGNNNWCGIRDHGSADDPRNGPGFNYARTTLSCAVDANKHIDAYRAATTISYYLVYSWREEAVFFQTSGWVNKTAEATGWSDVDISSDTGTDTAIAGIFLIDHVNAGGYRQIGMRAKGSTFNTSRYINDYSLGSIIVPVNGSGVCEQYTTDLICQTILIGYVLSGWVFPDPPTEYTIESTGSYIDIQLPEGATGAIFSQLSPYYDGYPPSADFRKNGSSSEKYFAAGHSHNFVECDTSRYIEYKTSRTTDLDFLLFAYKSADISATQKYILVLSNDAENTKKLLIIKPAST